MSLCSHVRFDFLTRLLDKKIKVNGKQIFQEETIVEVMALESGILCEYGSRDLHFADGFSRSPEYCNLPRPTTGILGKICSALQLRIGAEVRLNTDGKRRNSINGKQVFFLIKISVRDGIV